MPDWTSRLAVSFTDAQGSHDITPIDSFTPTFALAAEALHSLERTHIGVVYQPQNITFTMTVKAIGEATAKLTALALGGKTFDIVLQESEDGHDWSFQRVLLSRCIITSAAPSNATLTGAPTATFSGFALASTVEAKPGTAEAMTIP